jgi:Ca-activated chloride channel family protein
MSSPPAVTLELIPIRPAIQTDAPTTLGVLVRVLPPSPAEADPGAPARPPLNLALVLDRSGSMAAGGKLEAARGAAIFAVEQLLPADRVSVTVFDDAVATIVPSTPADDRGAIVAALEAVRPGNTTALHPAWKAGVEQVRPHTRPEALNRVLLLSDGLANVGLTNPDVIASEVRRAQSEGITTSTLGVGEDYNEDLMEAMARAGDGNYYYVESAAQLADLFQTELQGLMATVGREVAVGFEPQHGVEVADLLNDLESLPDGSRRASNLILGMPVEFALVLAVPPRPGVSELLRVRLSWDQPGREGRQTVARSLLVPAVPAAEWATLPEHPAVRERMALLQLARLKLQARERLVSGDVPGTDRVLLAARQLLMDLPQSVETATETESLTALGQHFRDRNVAGFSKLASFETYARRLGRRLRPGGTPPDAK